MLDFQGISSDNTKSKPVLSPLRSVLIGNKIQTNQEVLPAFIEDEDDSSYRTSTFINKEEADNQLTKYNLTLRSKDNKSEIMIKDYDSMNAQDEEN